MRKNFKLLSCVIAVTVMSGCVSTKPHLAQAKLPGGELLVSYQGPQAKIAVGDFELKTAGIEPQVSAAMKEYLVSVLTATKRFVMVAPQEADLVINVGVIEFVPENSGGKAGLGGGGSSGSGFMGGLLGEVLNKANLQLNLRIIERATSTVLASRDIQSQVVEHPGEKIRFNPDKAFRASLSDYAATPMGKVIYDCIIDSGLFIVQSVPENYYRESSSGKGETNGEKKT
jgi:curli biogenesis system outer membrane secretion channel CsgG